MNRTAPVVSLVIAVRNRDESLARSLASIAAQDAEAALYDVVIVNYGGTSRAQRLLEDAALPCGHRYIFVDEPGLFNESHAKNIGVKAAAGEYPVCVNADIILPPDTVTRLIAATADKGRDAVYQTQRIDCPPECDFVDFSAAKPYDLLACGDLQGAHRETWAKLCGYDEHMSGWGWMDIDLVLRAMRSGIAQYWIPDAVIYHQYHAENPVRRSRLNMVYTRERERLGIAQAVWGEPVSRRGVRRISGNLRRGREEAFRDGCAWVLEGSDNELAPKDPKTEAVFFGGVRIEGRFSSAIARRLFGTDVVYASRRMTVRTALFCNTLVPRFLGIIGALYLYRQCRLEHLLCEEIEAEETMRGGALFVLACFWFVVLKIACMPLTVIRERGFKKTLEQSLRAMERSRHG